MVSLSYRKIFLLKVVIWIVAILSFVWTYLSIDMSSKWQWVIFLVDMQDSMQTQDIDKDFWPLTTRQQVASQYIYDWIQQMQTGMVVGIVRLWYYPDYIVPPTTDRQMLETYIQSLASSPVSDVIIYETWDISLGDYMHTDKWYTYVLITDKQTTIQDIEQYARWLYTVFVWKNSSSPDIDELIQTRDDIQPDISSWWEQSSYLQWIFVIITLVWYILL